MPLHLHQNGTNNQNSQIISQLNVEELTHSDASIATFERLRRVYHFHPLYNNVYYESVTKKKNQTKKNKHVPVVWRIKRSWYMS